MLKKKFDLIQFTNNYIDSKRLNHLNKNLVNSVKLEIKEIVKTCNATLVHECKNFEDFDGRDVDTFFFLKKNFFDFEKKNVIFHQREKGSYRFLINDNNSSKFLNIDVEDLSIFSPKTKILNQNYINNVIRCKKTGLDHFNLEAIIFYKIVKYFSKGVIHSYEQLYKLKKTLNSLNSQTLNHILDLTKKNLPFENIWLQKLVENNFEDYEKDEAVKNFWINKRIIRQNKRKVFAGSLKLNNLFKSIKFLYAFLFGSFAIWSKNHKPLPAIAVIGNDGAGKTTICDYVIKNFSKMDPALFIMRSNTTIMPSTNYLKRLIKKICEYPLINKIAPLKKVFLFLGQSIDLLDKYIRYRIGVAFADSGFGITIFERYITDKLRGEFPNDKSKFLPLEQYFPFPDGLFYIDIKPEVSLERKINDNHSLDEMICKRANYLSLLEEFDEVKIIPCTNNFEQNIKDLKDYIFRLTVKKQAFLKSGFRLKRCEWRKNRSRVLKGRSINRFQKDSFL